MAAVVVGIMIVMHIMAHPRQAAADAVKVAALIGLIVGLMALFGSC